VWLPCGLVGIGLAVIFREIRKIGLNKRRTALPGLIATKLPMVLKANANPGLFKIALGLALFVVVLVAAIPAARGQLFEADSKQFGSSKMDIVLKEVERRPRASVVEIKITSVGSSVGSSFFILCSIRQLARLRGPYRYIVKLEEQPKRNQMLVGFLGDAEESPASAGPEFSRAGREAVIDLEQFAPVCDSMK
jgi:hypothetical protein